MLDDGAAAAGFGLADPDHQSARAGGGGYRGVARLSVLFSIVGHDRGTLVAFHRWLRSYSVSSSSPVLDRPITLDTHIQDALDAVPSGEERDIVLVGHSYGGSIISGVADAVPERVRTLVYLDALVPEDGDSAWSMTNDASGTSTAPGPPATPSTRYPSSTTAPARTRSPPCCRHPGSPAPGGRSPPRPTP